MACSLLFVGSELAATKHCFLKHGLCMDIATSQGKMVPEHMVPEKMVPEK